MTLALLSKRLTDSLRLEKPPVAISFTGETPPGISEFSGSVSAG
jgi:hypothetical protein